MPRFLDFLSVAAPKVFGGVCTVVLNVVLLRFFGPEQFGAYSLCVAAIVLADGIFGSAVDLGILKLAPAYRTTDARRSLQVQIGAFALKLAAIAVVLLFVVLFAEQIGLVLFHQAGHSALLYLTWAAGAAMLLLRSGLAHAQVEGRFALYGALEWLHNGLRFGGIALLLMLQTASPEAVLAWYVIGPLAALLVWAALSMRGMQRAWPLDLSGLRELLGFVKWSLLTFSFAALISRLDVFLLAALLSIEEVGVFSAGYVFACVPELIGTYLAVVLSPRVMPYFQEGRFFQFFRRFQLACFGVCLAVLVLAVLGLKGMLQNLIPPSFTRSADIFLILLPGALAGLATFPLTISFLMFVRPRFLFVMDCVTAPLMVICYVYGIQEHGAVGAAWVTSVFRLAKAAVAQVMAWKWANRPPEPGIVTPVPVLAMDPKQGGA